MTSTNDGKDVKTNQTTGPKAKLYYIELYKSLDSALVSAGPISARTAAVVRVWAHIHSLCRHSSDKTIVHLLSWLQGHTASLLLQTKWPESTEDHASLKDVLDAFIAEAEASSEARGSALAWELEFVERAHWYKTVLTDPWGHPVLKKFLDRQNLDEDELLAWLRCERGVSFATRLRQLSVSSCADVALRLVTEVMGKARGPKVQLDDDEGADKPSDPGGNISRVKEVLTNEAGFTQDVWDQLTDIEFMLLHKAGKIPDLIELAKQLPLESSKHLIERLSKRLEELPREKKLWKKCTEVASAIAKVIITRCMVSRSCGGAVLSALCGTARALPRLEPAPRLPAVAAALAAPAASARHLHALAHAIKTECKDTMRPFVCELYVRAITAGMNELEKLKLKTEKEAEVRVSRATLSEWFEECGALLADSARLTAECALTAFSLQPRPERYERLSAVPALTTLKTELKNDDQQPTSEFGSWANDSQTQTNFVKTSQTINMERSRPQTNVLPTTVLAEGEALGLSPELCKDLAVLLSGPRVKTLSWDMDREKLLENCRLYMEQTCGGTKWLSSELKYLNLDSAEYQTDEEEGENDLYYGIEKGYEHHVEVEPEPVQIWAHDINSETETAYSSALEEVVTEKKKKKKKSKAADVDPLSIAPTAEGQDTKKKKQKERKKKQKAEINTTTTLSSLIGVKVLATPEVPNDNVKKSKKCRKKKDNVIPVLNVPAPQTVESDVLIDGLFSLEETKLLSPPKAPVIMETPKDTIAKDSLKVDPKCVFSTIKSCPENMTKRERVNESIMKLLHYRKQKAVQNTSPVPPSTYKLPKLVNKLDTIIGQYPQLMLNTLKKNTTSERSDSLVKSNIPPTNTPHCTKVPLSRYQGVPVGSSNDVGWDDMISSLTAHRATDKNVQKVLNSNSNNSNNLKTTSKPVLNLSYNANSMLNVNKSYTSAPHTVSNKSDATSSSLNKISTQSAKTCGVQKKVEKAPNTFARRSYMHKNKLLSNNQEQTKQEAKPQVTIQDYNEAEKKFIREELDKQLAEFKKLKAIQATRDAMGKGKGTALQYPNTQSQGPKTKKVTQNKLALSNPVLSNMLSTLTTLKTKPQTKKTKNQRQMSYQDYFANKKKPLTDTATVTNKDQTIQPTVQPTKYLQNTVIQKHITKTTMYNTNCNQHVEQSISSMNTVEQIAVHSDTYTNTADAKKEKEQDWRDLMDRIQALKTPYRGPNALDMALNKNQESNSLRNQRIVKQKNPTIDKDRISTSTSVLRDMKTTPKQTVIQTAPSTATIIQQTRQALNAEKHMKKKSANINRVISNLNVASVNKHNAPLIPSAESYALLDEIEDRDLLQEIDEVPSSDEECSNANRPCNVTIPTPTVITQTRTAPLAKIQPTSNVISNKTSIPNASYEAPTSLTTMLYTVNNILQTDQPQAYAIPNKPRNVYVNPIEPTNVVLTPHGNAVSNVLLIRPAVYGSYQTAVQMQENQMYSPAVVNQNTYVLNQAPNIAVYQNTQFAAPAVNQLIVGNAMTITSKNQTEKRLNCYDNNQHQSQNLENVEVKNDLGKANQLNIDSLMPISKTNIVIDGTHQNVQVKTKYPPEKMIKVITEKTITAESQFTENLLNNKYFIAQKSQCSQNFVTNNNAIPAECQVTHNVADKNNSKSSEIKIAQNIVNNKKIAGLENQQTANNNKTIPTVSSKPSHFVNNNKTAPTEMSFTQNSVNNKKTVPVGSHFTQNYVERTIDNQIIINERKVLSEVQEKMLVVAKIEPKMNEKVDKTETKHSVDDQKKKENIERVKRKRNRIINREIHQRCYYPPIPLKYEPLRPTKSMTRSTSMDDGLSANNNNDIDDDSMNKKHSDLLDSSRIEELIISNYDEKTNNDSCKENTADGKLIRRIFLRSSSKTKQSLPNKGNKNVTGRKTKVRLKKKASGIYAEDESDSTLSKPLTRRRKAQEDADSNTKLPFDTSESEDITTSSVSTDRANEMSSICNELTDIESELKATKIKKCFFKEIDNSTETKKHPVVSEQKCDSLIEKENNTVIDAAENISNITPKVLKPAASTDSVNSKSALPTLRQELELEKIKENQQSSDQQSSDQQLLNGKESILQSEENVLNSIKIQQLLKVPEKNGEPAKQILKLRLPDGKIFKVTIFGSADITWDTLLKNPEIKNIVAKKNMTPTKNYRFNIKRQVLNNEEILLPKFKANDTETIDLISDEDEEKIAKLCFKTEFGAYRIRQLEDNSDFEKHQNKFNGKCVVALPRLMISLVNNYDINGRNSPEINNTGPTSISSESSALDMPNTVKDLTAQDSEQELIPNMELSKSTIEPNENQYFTERLHSEQNTPHSLKENKAMVSEPYRDSCILPNIINNVESKQTIAPKSDSTSMTKLKSDDSTLHQITLGKEQSSKQIEQTNSMTEPNKDEDLIETEQTNSPVIITSIESKDSALSHNISVKEQDCKPHNETGHASSPVIADTESNDSTQGLETESRIFSEHIEKIHTNNSTLHQLISEDEQILKQNIESEHSNSTIVSTGLESIDARLHIGVELQKSTLVTPIKESLQQTIESQHTSSIPMIETNNSTQERDTKNQNSIVTAANKTSDCAVLNKNILDKEQQFEKMCEVEESNSDVIVTDKDSNESMLRSDTVVSLELQKSPIVTPNETSSDHNVETGQSRSIVIKETSSNYVTCEYNVKESHNIKQHVETEISSSIIIPKPNDVNRNIERISFNKTKIVPKPTEDTQATKSYAIVLDKDSTSDQSSKQMNTTNEIIVLDDSSSDSEGIIDDSVVIIEDGRESILKGPKITGRVEDIDILKDMLLKDLGVIEKPNDPTEVIEILDDDVSPPDEIENAIEKLNKKLCRDFSIKVTKCDNVVNIYKSIKTCYIKLVPWDGTYSTENKTRPMSPSILDVDWTEEVNIDIFSEDSDFDGRTSPVMEVFDIIAKCDKVGTRKTTAETSKLLKCEAEWFATKICVHKRQTNYCCSIVTKRYRKVSSLISTVLKHLNNIDLHNFPYASLKRKCQGDADAEVPNKVPRTGTSVSDLDTDVKIKAVPHKNMNNLEHSNSQDTNCTFIEKSYTDCSIDCNAANNNEIKEINVGSSESFNDSMEEETTSKEKNNLNIKERVCEEQVSVSSFKRVLEVNEKCTSNIESTQNLYNDNTDHKLTLEETTLEGASAVVKERTDEGKNITENETQMAIEENNKPEQIDLLTDITDPEHPIDSLSENEIYQDNNVIENIEPETIKNTEDTFACKTDQDRNNVVSDQKEVKLENVQEETMELIINTQMAIEENNKPEQIDLLTDITDPEHPIDSLSENEIYQDNNFIENLEPETIKNTEDTFACKTDQDRNNVVSDQKEVKLENVQEETMELIINTQKIEFPGLKTEQYCEDTIDSEVHGNTVLHQTENKLENTPLLGSCEVTNEIEPTIFTENIETVSCQSNQQEYTETHEPAINVYLIENEKHENCTDVIEDQTTHVLLVMSEPELKEQVGVNLHDHLKQSEMDFDIKSSNEEVRQKFHDESAEKGLESPTEEADLPEVTDPEQIKSSIEIYSTVNVDITCSHAEIYEPDNLPAAEEDLNATVSEHTSDDAVQNVLASKDDAENALATESNDEDKVNTIIEGKDNLELANKDIAKCHMSVDDENNRCESKQKSDDVVTETTEMPEKQLESKKCESEDLAMNCTSPVYVFKSFEFEDPINGTCYVFQPIEDDTFETSSNKNVEVDSLNDSSDYYIINDDCEPSNDCTMDNASVNTVEPNKTDEEKTETSITSDEHQLTVIKPSRTYLHNRLKRKIAMKDVKVKTKRYRNGKNIDYPKLSATMISESSYRKEYNQLINYIGSVEFSYNVSYHKDAVNVDSAIENWPIFGPVVAETIESNKHDDERLFENNIDFLAEFSKNDPLNQTFVQEISLDCSDAQTAGIPTQTNLNKGFGEGSGRVIQNLKEEGEFSTFSAATLSDVKQTQPFLLSEDYKRIDCDKYNSFSYNKDQISQINRYIKYMKLKERVRMFFNKTRAELENDDSMRKDSDHIFDNVPGLYCTEFLRPAPLVSIVHVVQVGQLPVSAAAQNPVTCDPRVTQVSDASPSQCSVESSPRSENNQANIKAEYTELTNADLSLPLVQDMHEHSQAMPVKSQDRNNSETENHAMQKEIQEVNDTKANVENCNNVDTEQTNNNSTPDGKLQDSIFNFDRNSENINANELSTEQILFDSNENGSDSFLSQKQENGALEKTDQIAHAMNAAGITTTPEATVTNARAHPLVNILSQKVIRPSLQTNNLQSTANSFSKTTINAMALQQALAQILPPPLNQTSGVENSQGTQNAVGPQVLHIVQGKNASGNQITLVDNSQQSVISTPNATQVLHIVQNKSAAGTNSNGTASGQTNSFSGLSLVDGGLQQGGNQLLHIVNTGNQKNANTAQLLKRVNLLTNLANVQGGNEQKMVQFVCKSADGKAIHLNAPHQRSMVLRLQPIETPNVQAAVQKPPDNQEVSPSQANNQNKDANQQEIKSRSVYEENYAKFIQNSSSKTPASSEKSQSLPKFNQAFGKTVYQDGSQKQNEINTNTHLTQEGSECQSAENTINLDHISRISSPPLLLRKATAPTTQSQPNLVQQIKQTIAPMNIQTMHGGVIYTRQIPVNIGGGQTINLITVPSTELIDDSGQKQQTDVKFVSQDSIEPSIIKIVPQSQPNADNSNDENHMGVSGDGSQTPQHQPVLTQMRIKLPMLSKTPQVVPGTRVVRPSFFQIQRNMIGGANQQVYQQLVLTAAPPLGQQTIRLPQAQPRPVKVPPESPTTSESQLSSSTLEQLREFDMVLEQVKERSTVQPNATTTTFTKLHTASSDTTDGAATPSTNTTTVETAQQVLYSMGTTSTMNVAYVNRKTTVTTPTTSTFVRSPDSSGIADSPSSAQMPSTASDPPATSSESSQPKPAKIGSKSVKSRPSKPATHTPSAMKVNTIPPKTTTQKPLEDEQTTQRILYILAEYKEQVENSPDKDKPAPRRRSNPPSNPSGNSKRKKSSSGSRRPGCTRDHSPITGDDTCRTMGSEDSSCGTSQGDCNESCSIDTHSPQDSPRKVVRKLTFEHETPVAAQPRPQAPRNVIVADGQTITVARSATGKPTTAVLMPANYILPVSMMKGGQQIAIVTNRGPKLLTVGGTGGEGGGNALLLQRLIGPGGLKPVLARPGVRHVRLPTAALHNLQALSLAPAPAATPWPDAPDVKPERAASPDEPWRLRPGDPPDYTYQEPAPERTVLDPIPDRYSPDMEAQRIFDKMFDVDTKKSYIVEGQDESPRVGHYDIDASHSDGDEKAFHQVVQKKDGSSHGLHRVTHISSAALRHKYAILEHELRLQKSLSEECSDLGVDSPSASELFPEAELLFAASPAHDHAHDNHAHAHTPQPSISQTTIPQPDLEDHIATDHLIPVARDDLDPQQDLTDNLGLGDVGIVTVSEDGLQTTIALDQEEFARSHPNTTFHSEPTDDCEVQPFSMSSSLKGRHISSTIFGGGASATVLMTAPHSVISAADPQPVKYDLDNMINSIPGTHNADINLSSVLVKDDGLTRFDSILTDRELHLSNTASAIVHSGNATQVIRRVCYEDDKRDRERWMDDSDAIIAGDDAKMSVAEESSRDATLESIGDADDVGSSPERHAELFWESNSASVGSESRRPLDFSSDSDKCCKSPSLDETNSTDSSGVGTQMRLDSVIKEARGRSASVDGSSADDTQPPIRTYPAKRSYHEHERSLSGKTRAGEGSPDSGGVRRRASGRGVVKRGCSCCGGEPAPSRPKKQRQRKPNADFTSNG